MPLEAQAIKTGYLTVKYEGPDRTNVRSGLVLCIGPEQLSLSCSHSDETGQARSTIMECHTRTDMGACPIIVLTNVLHWLNKLVDYHGY